MVTPGAKSAFEIPHFVYDCPSCGSSCRTPLPDHLVLRDVLYLQHPIYGVEPYQEADSRPGLYQTRARPSKPERKPSAPEPGVTFMEAYWRERARAERRRSPLS